MENKISPLEVQVGGKHYKTLKMQPAELCALDNLNGFQLSIIKYVSRYKSKNVLEDLNKILHWANLGAELCPVNFCASRYIEDYCKLNKLGSFEKAIVKYTARQEWKLIYCFTEKLIKQEYAGEEINEGK